MAACTAPGGCWDGAAPSCLAWQFGFLGRIQNGLFVKGLSHSLPDSRDFSLQYGRRRPTCNQNVIRACGSRPSLLTAGGGKSPSDQGRSPWRRLRARGADGARNSVSVADASDLENPKWPQGSKSSLFAQSAVHPSSGRIAAKTAFLPYLGTKPSPPLYGTFEVKC
jgi:hypothetical protein